MNAFIHSFNTEAVSGEVSEAVSGEVRGAVITLTGLSLSLDYGIATRLTIALWLTLSGKNHTFLERMP